MDTVEAFFTSDTAPAEIQELGVNPTQFIVAGGSKRGWTTWMVGAVDPRVMAIIPVLMDELNCAANIRASLQILWWMVICTPRLLETESHLIF